MAAIPKILIVDDEAGLLRAIALQLENYGFEAITAYDGIVGLEKIESDNPDLIVLDINMPKMDGFKVCGKIREFSNLPVIMVTARAAEDDIIKGFEMGADDYVTKPYRIRELVARINAVLWRANIAADQLSYTYEDDWLSINLANRIVEVAGETIRLSATEFKLMAMLLKNINRVVETEEILTAVWGSEYQGEIAYVRVYISHLRQKLERDPNNPEYILTERQVGYKFLGKNSNAR